MFNSNELCEYYHAINNDLLSFFSENLSYSFKQSIFRCFEEFENNHANSINEFGMYIENQRMKIMMIVFRIRLSHYSAEHRNELIKGLLALSELYYHYRKYGQNASNWNYYKENLEKDLDCFSKAEAIARDEAISYLYVLQKIMDFLNDYQTGEEECTTLIKNITNRRITDEREIEEYLKGKINTEEKDGQAENGN